jgi:hypothetical protein
MFTLWAISGILAYAHKIPFIGRIITLLSIWYGRTTIWKILLKIRKAFIAFNAVIGVYMVYKSIGFGMDNILAGFTAMGHTYLEILINFTKRLFNWIFELFDHKIVPNVSNNSSRWPFTFNTPDSPSMWPLSQPKPNESVVDNILNSPKSLRETYGKGMFNITVNTTPWYRDLSTWLWFGTIAGGAILTLGTGVFIYKFITDPLFINDWSKGSPTTNINPPTPEEIVKGATKGAAKAVASAPIELKEARAAGLVSNLTALGNSTSMALGYITNPISKGLSYLNPSYWFMSDPNVSNSEAFYQRQWELTTYDDRFYPFTNINPNESWIQRMRVVLFGETAKELEIRLIDKNYALREYLALQVQDTSVYGSPTPNTVGSFTPNILGFGMKQVSGSPFIEFIEATTSAINTERLLESVTPVPQGGPSEWASHIVDKADLDVYREKFTKGKAAWWGTIPNPIEALDEVIDKTSTPIITSVIESNPTVSTVIDSITTSSPTVTSVISSTITENVVPITDNITDPTTVTSVITESIKPVTENIVSTPTVTSVIESTITETISDPTTVTSVIESTPSVDQSFLDSNKYFNKFDFLGNEII